MSELFMGVKCPKCHKKMKLPAALTYPGASTTCSRCGVEIRFDEQSADGRMLQAAHQQAEIDKRRFRTLRFRILMSLLPFVAIAMFLTNPDEESLRAKFVAQGREHAGDTGALLTEVLLSTRYKNFYLFSIGGTAASTEARHAPYLGLFGHWFALTRADHVPK